jgi:hypothetical protein
MEPVLWPVVFITTTSEFDSPPAFHFWFDRLDETPEFRLRNP